MLLFNLFVLVPIVFNLVHVFPPKTNTQRIQSRACRFPKNHGLWMDRYFQLVTGIFFWKIDIFNVRFESQNSRMESFFDVFSGYILTFERQLLE